MDFSLIVYLHVIADIDFSLEFVDAIFVRFSQLDFPKILCGFSSYSTVITFGLNLSSVRLYFQISIHSVILFKAIFDSDQLCYKVSPSAQFYW